MKNKMKRNTLAALVLVSVFAGLGLIDRAHSNKQEKKHQEFSALYQATITAQEIAGENGASDTVGQELLDSLGIKYTLKENEKVTLDTGSSAVYVNVRSPSKRNGETRGFANKESLERYIANHQ